MSMSQRAPKQPIVRFGTDALARAFWKPHHLSDYVNREKAKKVSLPSFRPPMEAVSLRPLQQ